MDQQTIGLHGFGKCSRHSRGQEARIEVALFLTVYRVRNSI